MCCKNQNNFTKSQEWGGCPFISSFQHNMEKFEPNLLISVTTASYLIISMYQITTYYTVPDEGIYYYVPDEGKYYFEPDEVRAR